MDPISFDAPTITPSSGDSTPVSTGDSGVSIPDSPPVSFGGSLGGTSSPLDTASFGAIPRSSGGPADDGTLKRADVPVAKTEGEPVSTTDEKAAKDDPLVPKDGPTTDDKTAPKGDKRDVPKDDKAAPIDDKAAPKGKDDKGTPKPGEKMPEDMKREFDAFKGKLPEKDRIAGEKALNDPNLSKEQRDRIFNRLKEDAAKRKDDSPSPDGKGGSPDGKGDGPGCKDGNCPPPGGNPGGNSGGCGPGGCPSPGGSGGSGGSKGNGSKGGNPFQGPPPSPPSAPPPSPPPDRPSDDKAPGGSPSPGGGSKAPSPQEKSFKSISENLTKNFDRLQPEQRQQGIEQLRNLLRNMPEGEARTRLQRELEELERKHNEKKLAEKGGDKKADDKGSGSESPPSEPPSEK